MSAILANARRDTGGLRQDVARAGHLRAALRAATGTTYLATSELIVAHHDGIHGCEKCGVAVLGSFHRDDGRASGATATSAAAQNATVTAQRPSSAWRRYPVAVLCVRVLQTAAADVFLLRRRDQNVMNKLADTALPASWVSLWYKGLELKKRLCWESHAGFRSAARADRPPGRKRYAVRTAPTCTSAESYFSPPAGNSSARL